jgi:hypothetical protein
VSARERLLKHLAVPAGIGQPWWRNEIALLALEAAADIAVNFKSRQHMRGDAFEIASAIRALAEEVRRAR